MAYAITQSCCADASCVSACPVNCIHPTPDEPGFGSGRDADLAKLRTDDVAELFVGPLGDGPFDVRIHGWRSNQGGVTTSGASRSECTEARYVSIRALRSAGGRTECRERRSGSVRALRTDDADCRRLGQAGGTGGVQGVRCVVRTSPQTATHRRSRCRACSRCRWPSCATRRPRRCPTPSARSSPSTPPKIETMAADDDEYSGFNDTRQKRVKVIAWVTIVALILVGGGATVFALLFG